MSIIAAAAWFVLCSAIALSEADLAVHMHDTGHPGMYRLYMLAALVQAGMAGVNLIIALSGGYAQSIWLSTWLYWGLAATLWVLLLLARKVEDGPACDPEQGRES
ncbi:hypothetical protein [Bifidobacterium italicum]|uniref:hypothetical protein n=1 Tax=Bifidobacterium italicum TaxID=1960968 RepID=UPI00138FD461|nr:hypothetical protein [Bifidobacterium italicum]